MKHTKMTFGEALTMLQHGARICRPGWNGKGTWLELVPATEKTRAYVQMVDSQGIFVPWLPSQTELFATDWETKLTR